MVHFDPATSLGAVARSVPGALGVFDDLHIDYCCAGERSLADACAVRGLDAADVVARLYAAADTGAVDGTAWSARTLAALIDHIVTTYHAFTRVELRRIRRLVAAAQGEVGVPASLGTIAALLAQLEDEMTPHMVMEERILFPYVIELEARTRAGNRRPLLPSGAADNPLREMMREHRHADATLRKLREAASDYVPPPAASPSLAAVYAALERLERTMHHHVHLESNVLFPRALELERR